MALKQVLSNFPDFCILQDRDFEWIESVARQQLYQPGSVLVEGESVTSLYICLSGSLTLTLSGQSGSKQLIATLLPGQLIAETFLLNSQPVMTAIVVAEPSELLVFPQEELTEYLEQNRDFAARFYRLLAVEFSKRLRAITLWMVSQKVPQGQSLRKVLMMFAILSDSDVAWMVASGVAEKVASGIVLIQEQKPVPAVYLLLDGTLGIYASISNGDTVVEKEIAKSVRGEILGEVSFADGGVASSTVKALENAWVLALPQQTLATKFEEDQGFAGRFYRSIALILANRSMDLLVRGSFANLTPEQATLLSDSSQEEDELDLDLLEGTALAGTRFDWMIQQLRR